MVWIGLWGEKWRGKGIRKNWQQIYDEICSVKKRTLYLSCALLCYMGRMLHEFTLNAMKKWRQQKNALQYNLWRLQIKCFRRPTFQWGFFFIFFFCFCFISFIHFKWIREKRKYNQEKEKLPILVLTTSVKYVYNGELRKYQKKSHLAEKEIFKLFLSSFLLLMITMQRNSQHIKNTYEFIKMRNTWSTFELPTEVNIKTLNTSPHWRNSIFSNLNALEFCFPILFRCSLSISKIRFSFLSTQQQL